jgi:threonine/homoserine efflux transporter RhtA
MTEIATIVCLVLALGVVLPCAVKALRDRPIGRLEVTAAGLLEAGLLFYVGVRVADLIDGHRPASPAVAIAYLVGILLVMPVAAALGIAERSRWGPIVLGVGALVVCVLFARIDQVWRPHG